MEKFLCIDNHCNEPYFNLALEEYLLKNKSNNIFILWQNQPSVIVGKHQNIQAEINHRFIENKQIIPARRLSGGGTVYHDLGNLNFTYIMNGEEGKLVDFTKYTNDILLVLNKLGVPATRDQRNNLMIGNKKISGNAEHIFKRRVLHHGTLLFNSDLDALNEAILVEPGKYSDKAVQSVRSHVTNIAEHINKSMSVVEFKDYLMESVLNKYSNTILYELEQSELEQIEILKQQKYASWDWIYGYSPKYVLKREINTEAGNLNIELSIVKGQIVNAVVLGNVVVRKHLDKLEKMLKGQRHDKNLLLKNMSKNADIRQINALLHDNFINYLF